MLGRKGKIKNFAVLDLRSATDLEAFLMKQGFACLKCFRCVQEVCMSNHTPHMPKPGIVGKKTCCLGEKGHVWKKLGGDMHSFV